MTNTISSYMLDRSYDIERMDTITSVFEYRNVQSMSQNNGLGISKGKFLRIIEDFASSKLANRKRSQSQ